MSNVKRVCNTCRHQDEIREDSEVVGGIKIWCDYKEKWVSKFLISQAESCSDWGSASTARKGSYFSWGYNARERLKNTFKLIFWGILAAIGAGMMGVPEIAVGALLIFGGLAALNFAGSIWAFIMGE